MRLFKNIVIVVEDYYILLLRVVEESLLESCKNLCKCFLNEYNRGDLLQFLSPLIFELFG
jgi:hypothetical protein